MSPCRRPVQRGCSALAFLPWLEDFGDGTEIGLTSTLHALDTLRTRAVGETRTGLSVPAHIIG
jgi:hypothetical protein